MAATTVKKPSENSSIKRANRRRCERKQKPQNRGRRLHAKEAGGRGFESRRPCHLTSVFSAPVFLASRCGRRNRKETVSKLALSGQRRQASRAVLVRPPVQLRQRIRAVLEWAVAMDLRPDNPCDRIGPVLGAQGNTVRHMRALPHTEVASALRTVRASNARPVTKLAFEFLV